MRVPLRLERSAALFVSMHFASFGGQGSKVLVGCRHDSMAHSIFYHFKGHLALTLTYVGYPYRERDRPRKARRDMSTSTLASSAPEAGRS